MPRNRWKRKKAGEGWAVQYLAIQDRFQLRLLLDEGDSVEVVFTPGQWEHLYNAMRAVMDDRKGQHER